MIDEVDSASHIFLLCDIYISIAKLERRGQYDRISTAKMENTK